MRIKKTILVPLLLSSFPLCGCNSDQGNSTQGAHPVTGTKLLDYWSDGGDFLSKAEAGVALPEYPGVTFLYDNSAGELKANEKVIHCGMSSLYATDFDGDGYRELCIGFAVGSGIVDKRIDIYDYRNGKPIFQLNHRGGYLIAGNRYVRLLAEHEHEWIVFRGMVPPCLLVFVSIC